MSAAGAAPADRLFGWGEATLEWKTRAVVGAVEDLAPLLMGRDPRDIEQAVRVLKKHSFWRLGVIGKANATLFTAIFPLIGLLAAIFILPELYGYDQD